MLICGKYEDPSSIKNMDNMIAVEGFGVTHHVEAIPRRKPRNNVDLFVGVEPDNVFEGYLFVGPHSAGTGAANDLEVDEMDMDGVCLCMS